MSDTRIPVIIDTDPGVDDVLALLLALASPEIEILAIIVSFGNTIIHSLAAICDLTTVIGNTDRYSSYINILKAYQAVARHIAQFPEDASRFPGMTPIRKTTLALGEDMPLQGELHSAQYFHGRDGLGDITGRHPELNCDNEAPTDHPQLSITTMTGVEVALGLIKSEPERSISYIALGPLTNLAKLLRLDGNTVRSRIGRVVCMGGALDVPGNTSPAAEFNFYADPYAVKELLVPSDPGHALPLERFILLPLDITTPHELSFPHYKATVDPAFATTASPSRLEGKAPLVHFTSSFFERTREVMVEFGKDAMELHDIAAVWCAIANPPVKGDEEGTLPTLQDGWKVAKRKFDVERVGELTRGMLVVDRRDDQGAYAPGANRAEVQAELERHQFQHTGAYESTAVPAPVEIEARPATQNESSINGGVPCVTQTPGSEALVQLLLERVWGVRA
ncbi:nucleoside hydrolase [Trametes gibbosa]|nr:nucleoside hydrolase [Trametes gibbosa]